MIRNRVKNRNLYRISVYDILLIGAFVVIPMLSLTPIWHPSSRSNDVRIYKENRLLEIQSLQHDRIISYGNVKVQIENGRARFLESNCPRRICVHTGWIDKPGQTVVCVPNRMLMEITGNRRTKYHATSY